MNDNYIFYSLLYQLALKAKWICRPNPAVAAVVVKNNRIISWGYTQAVGKPHAEVEALSKLSRHQVAGCDLYVTLMPCSFISKTPPCTEIIIQSGIKNIHVAGFDNDHRMMSLNHKSEHPNFRSASIFRKAGITLYYDCPIAIAEKLFFLNWDYFKKNAVGLPTITLKYAMTLDGKIAGSPLFKNSQQTQNYRCSPYEKATRKEIKITGKEIRKETHSERAQHDVVLVGGNTLRNDNPRLNARVDNVIPNLSSLTLEDLLSIEENLSCVKKKPKQIAPQIRCQSIFPDLSSKIIQPIPMVLTRSQQSPKLYLIRKKSSPRPLFIIPSFREKDFPAGLRLILTSPHAINSNVFKKTLGSQHWHYEGSPFSKEFWTALWKEIGITSVFLEGGAALQTYLWETGLIDRIHVYISPRLFRRGIESLSPFTPHVPGSPVSPVLCDLWQPRTMVWGKDIKVSGFINNRLVKKIWKSLTPYKNSYQI